jgi:hypothetical protein
VETVFKLFMVLVLLGGARFLYFRCFTELGLEMGWESAQHDPFQKMTSKTKRDFVFNSRMYGFFAIPFCIIMALSFVAGIFFPA